MKELLSEYLYYYLYQPSFRAEGSSKMVGAVGHKRIPKEFYERSFIPLPPLPIQKQIVQILDEAFAAIDKAKANIQKNIQNAEELFKSKLNDIFSQRSNDWSEKELQKVCKFIDYRGRTPQKTKKGIRLITAKNVRMGFIKKEPEEFIDVNDYDNWMTRGIPCKGDVLFTTEAPLANVALLDLDEKIALAQRIITLVPDKDNLLGEFLSFCLQSKLVQDRIFSNGTGATVTGIKSKLLKKILIPIAPINYQEKIINDLKILRNNSESLIKIYNHKLSVLDELKKSLLQKAFSGELTKEVNAA